MKRPTGRPGHKAFSYTTGVSAVVGAMLMLQNIWQGRGVFNVEEFDPDPFLESMSQNGLCWKEATGLNLEL